MVDIIPLKKWPGGIGELESGDKIPYAFLGIDGQLGGQRNKIINGKMEFAQRGTSFSAPNGYTLDRWQVILGGGGVVTASQQLDAPSSNEFRASLRAIVTTADTSIAASDFCLTIQKIEGFNVRDLIGKSFTLSFWVRSSKVGKHCVGFRNSTSDRSYVLEYTVNAANTWEYKTVSVVGGLITAGTWDWTAGIGLDVVFTLAAGSSYRTTPGAWQTGNFVATANQVNCLDAVGNTFAITGVQLEVGPVATPFEHRQHGVELSLCERYYEVVRWGVQWFSSGTGPNYSLGSPIAFRQSKRATPTISTIATIINVNAYNLLLGAVSAFGAYGAVEPTAANICNLTVDLAISSEL